MENNGFKNNVQEQLSGLRFEPSDMVWPKVELQLKKEKKKHRIIFFWILLGVLLLGSGLISFFNTRATHSISISAQQHNDNVKEKNNSTDSAKSMVAFKGAKAATTDSNIKSLIVTSAKTTDHFLTPDNKLRKAMGKTRTKIIAADQGNGDAADFNEMINGKTIVKQKNPRADSVAEDFVQTIKIEQKNIHTDTGVAVINPPVTTDIKNVTDTAITVTSDNKKKDKKEKKPGWTFAVTGSFGASNIGKGFTVKSTDNSTSRNVSYSTIGVGIPPVNVNNVASPFTKGFSFSTGAEATKKISNRFSFVTGLQYSYVSAGQLTGNFEDTMANISPGRIAFRQGSTNNYTNRFHYISIPVNLQTRWFTYSHLSGELVTGISLIQMIATNALVYDTAVKMYYRKKSVFNKTGIAFNAGIMLSYTVKNKIMISAGPQLQHSISTVGKEANYSNNYFNVWALKASYILNRKNKPVTKTAVTQ